MVVIFSEREMTAINNVHSLEGSCVLEDMEIRSRDFLLCPLRPFSVASGFTEITRALWSTPPCYGGRAVVPFYIEATGLSKYHAGLEAKGWHLCLAVFSISLWSRVV